MQIIKQNTENWHIVNDSVMGGQSSSQFSINAYGLLVWNGSVSLENGGGFASIKYLLHPSLNLQNYTGIGLQLIGDGKTYKLNLANSNTSKSPRFQARFDTNTRKQSVNIPFSALKASVRGKSVSENFDLSHISMLGFLIADQQDGAFCLRIKSITAYV